MDCQGKDGCMRARERRAEGVDVARVGHGQ